MIDPAEFDSKGLPLTARAVSVFFSSSHFVDQLHLFEGFLHWTWQKSESKFTLSSNYRKKFWVRFLDSFFDFFIVIHRSEILRLLDSLQLSARLPVATPVDWKVNFIRFDFFLMKNVVVGWRKSDGSTKCQRWRCEKIFPSRCYNQKRSSKWQRIHSYGRSLNHKTFFSLIRF